MAEVTSMRNNALPYPVYGVAFAVTFPLLDADGDPISPSSPDSEVSKNGDTFADCTNEATEIATSSGICYLLLTASEMTADIVTVRIQSTGAKTTILTLYPRKLPILATGTCQGANDTGDIQLASGDSAIDDYYNGCLCVAVIDGTTEARLINDYVGSTKVGEVSPAWNTAAPDNTDTYTIYLPEGRQVVPTDVKAYGGIAGTFSGGRPEVNTTHAAGTAWNSGAIGASTLASDTIAAAKIATGAITATKFAASAIDAAALATDAVAEIQSGLATAAALDAVDNFLDTEIASIISTLGTPAGASLAADLVVIDDFVDALESRLTAARAGYLDNINNSALASVPAFPSNFTSLGINASGHVSRVTLVDTTTTNTDMITAAGIRTAVGLAAANLDTQLTAIDDYLDTELAAVLAAVDTEIAAIVAAIGTPSNLGGGATLAANLADIEAQTDDIGTAGAGLTAIPWNASWDAEVQSEVTDALNAALTESYRADQATGSVAQMLYELIAHHGEVSIGGTTKTLKKIDGSTTAMSFTLNSGTTPTAVTRAA